MFVKIVTLATTLLCSDTLGSSECRVCMKKKSAKNPLSLVDNGDEYSNGVQDDGDDDEVVDGYRKNFRVIKKIKKKKKFSIIFLIVYSLLPSAKSTCSCSYRNK